MTHYLAWWVLVVATLTVGGGRFGYVSGARWALDDDVDG
jgi:hypothetical protein